MVLISGNCTCLNYTTKCGKGKCRTTSSHFDGRPYCYVEESSSCKDIVPSVTELGKHISADACHNGRYSEITFYYRPFIDKAEHFLNKNKF